MVLRAPCPPSFPADPSGAGGRKGLLQPCPWVFVGGVGIPVAEGHSTAGSLLCLLATKARGPVFTEVLKALA